jgi:hypothetical protein
MFDKLWFQKYQKLLLYFANTFIGRYILRIQGKRSLVGKNKIVGITPNAIYWKKGKTYVAEFRTHNKFSKRLYYAFYPLWWLMHQWDTLFANNFQPAWNLGFDTTGDLFPAAGSNSPVDGQVSRIGVNETLATIVAGAGTAFNNAYGNLSTYLLATGTSGQYSNLDRSIFLFDTSVIPAGATIDSAVVSLYGAAKNNGLGSPDLIIVASSPASTSTLANGDFQTIGSVSFGSVTYANFSLVAYNDITLNASGRANITKAGISKFGARNSFDFNGSGATWASGADSYVQPWEADRAGTSEDPKLVVTYTVAGGGFFALL